MRKMNENEFLKIIGQFARLKNAAIDASSMIYLQRLDLLDLVSSVLKLFTTRDVLDETGFDSLPITIVREGINSKQTPDDQLFNLARKLNCALISEDRKILKKARNAGIDHFNTLMILIFLFRKNYLTEEELQSKANALHLFARYDRQIREYGEDLIARIMNA